jgi:hypothetical protein
MQARSRPCRFMAGIMQSNYHAFSTHSAATRDEGFRKTDGRLSSKRLLGARKPTTGGLYIHQGLFNVGHFDASQIPLLFTSKVHFDYWQGPSSPLQLLSTQTRVLDIFSHGRHGGLLHQAPYFGFRPSTRQSRECEHLLLRQFIVKVSQVAVQ